MLNPAVLRSRVATLALARRNFTHVTWVSGPPRVRIPFAEKLVHMAFISIGILIGPAWILSHLQDYKKRD